MPPSTNASYVGRLAPPGRPNTTSTPSAFKHSMMASTARMSRPPLNYEQAGPSGRQEQVSLASAQRRSRRLGGQRLLRELELGPAAHAERVVELAHAPARRALAAQLVAFGAVADRREQPDDRNRARDQEP